MVDESADVEHEFVAEGVGLADFLVVVVIVNHAVIALGFLAILPWTKKFGATFGAEDAIVGGIPFAFGIFETEEGLEFEVFLFGTAESEKDGHELVVGEFFFVVGGGGCEGEGLVFLVEIVGGGDELGDAGLG